MQWRLSPKQLGLNPPPGPAIVINSPNKHQAPISMTRISVYRFFYTYTCIHPLMPMKGKSYDIAQMIQACEVVSENWAEKRNETRTGGTCNTLQLEGCLTSRQSSWALLTRPVMHQRTVSTIPQSSLDSTTKMSSQVQIWRVAGIYQYFCYFSTAHTQDNCYLLYIFRLNF